MTANFNRIARAYRWMEYLSFGRVLERCRFYFLPQLRDVRRALVIGDGDGRFLVRLLRQYPALKADAVDASPAMLRLLEIRCESGRVTPHCIDAMTFTPQGTYDCIATHFFLDCLTTEECAMLAQRIAPHLTPGGAWIVSEFRIPTGRMKTPATLLVRGLYAAFRLLTGLQPQSLPDHVRALRDAGLVLEQERLFLAGILTAQLWRINPVSAPRN